MAKISSLNAVTARHVPTQNHLNGQSGKKMNLSRLIPPAPRLLIAPDDNFFNDGSLVGVCI
jgi:hypothetical protein